MKQTASAKRLDTVFKAVSDSTRRAILQQLSTGPKAVVEVAKGFSMSLPSVSKHIRVLEDAGLIKRRVEGRVHHLHLNAKPMKEATEWLEFYHQYWSLKLNSLERYLQEESTKEKDSSHD
ncbi:MAG: ArsR/SmtB family transcription factor [Sumerlaeia bacterium]